MQTNLYMGSGKSRHAVVTAVGVNLPIREAASAMREPANDAGRLSALHVLIWDLLSIQAMFRQSSAVAEPCLKSFDKATGGHPAVVFCSVTETIPHGQVNR